VPTGSNAGKLRRNFDTQHTRVEVGVDVDVDVGSRVGLRVGSELSRVIDVGLASRWRVWCWVVVLWGFSVKV
jgi:hypothetical protein